MRPSGTIFRRNSCTASGVEPRARAAASRKRSCIGVSTIPGSTALTRIPRGAYAYAKLRVIELSAAFEAQ